MKLRIKAAPLSDDAKQRLDMNMMTPIAEEIIGDYELHLVSSPLLPYPQVGLQRAGRDFTDLDQQYDPTPHALGMVNLVKIKQTLNKWLEQYGKLLVGTFDEKKIVSYKSLLARLKFKTHSQRMGPLEIVVISK